MKVKIKHLIKLHNFIHQWYRPEYLEKCIVNDYEIIHNQIEVETNNKTIVFKIGNEYYYNVSYLEFNQLKELYKSNIQTVNDIIIKEIIE